MWKAFAFAFAFFFSWGDYYTFFFHLFSLHATNIVYKFCFLLVRMTHLFFFYNLILIYDLKVNDLTLKNRRQKRERQRQQQQKQKQKHQRSKLSMCMCKFRFKFSFISPPICYFPIVIIVVVNYSFICCTVSLLLCSFLLFFL